MPIIFWVICLRERKLNRNFRCTNNNFQLNLDDGYPSLSVGMFFKTSGGLLWETHDLGGIHDGTYGMYWYLQSFRNSDGFEIHYLFACK